MSKEATIQARVSWAKTAEDCFIAMQNLASMGETLDATKIQLISRERLGELVNHLQSQTRGAHASANQVVAACDDILVGRVRCKPQPLIRLGQGDFTRDVFEEDLIRDRVRKQAGKTWISRLLGVVR